ncbi:MAG: DJ-1/PfpI family protein [Candidatus Obscuribacterales bacterium]|nr:DJ-1/PfpI family protein [Candidatus Obscuribacterales bacterium]
MAGQRLSGRRILMVIAPAQFRDEELLEPKKIFLQEGAEVVIAASKLGDVRGMLGGTVSPDILISDAKPEQYDACVIVGGMGSPTHLWNDIELHEILRSMEPADKVIAAICLSTAVLAKAGVIEDRKVTVFATDESLAALKEGGAIYLKEHVVRDGLIITADGPEAATKFGQVIVDTLSSVPARA